MVEGTLYTDKEKNTQITTYSWRVLFGIAILLVLPRVLSHYHIVSWNWTQCNSDLRLYFAHAQNIISGSVPYRDFVFEYPPLAMLPIVVPAFLSGTGTNSFAAYSWLYMLLSILSVWLLRWQLTSYKLADKKDTILFIVFILMFSPLLPYRLDCFVTVCIFTSVILVLKQRIGMAGIILGASIMMKLFPLVLLPVLFVVLWKRDSIRSAIRYALWVVGTCFIVQLPFLLLAGSNAFVYVQYHSQRGLQIESIVAGALRLFSTNNTIPVLYNFGAEHLNSALATAIALYMPAISALVLVIVTAMVIITIIRTLSKRQVLTNTTIAQMCLLVLLVFVVTSKVFSPQYLIWYFPFVIMIRERYTTLLYSCICIITMIYFTSMYDTLILGEIFPMVLLNFRNALFILLTCWVGYTALCQTYSIRRVD